MNTLKLRWAKRFLRSKQFVVVTDREAVISVDGVNPDDLTDIIMVQSQRASLIDFKERLEVVIKDHDLRVRQLNRTGDTSVKTSTGRNTPKAEASARAKGTKTR